MNTLKLTRLRVAGKLRWGWIFCRDGKPQYQSAGFFTSRSKVLCHFWKYHRGLFRGRIIGVEETEI